MTAPIPRRVVEMHRIQAYDENEAQAVELTVAAVHLGRGVGPAVDVGHYSMTCADAALLAESLLMLAELADPDYRQDLQLPAWDPNEFRQQMETDENGGAAS